MARRVKAFNVWKEMSRALLWRLAGAVFLMFSILGPLSVLMESKTRVVPWTFILIQCLSSGGLAASIILLGRKRWWVIFFLTIFWTGIMVMNSGGLSFVFGDGGFRVQLGTSMGVLDHVARTTPLTIAPQELSAIYEQRAILGVLAIAFLASGYIMFILVIRTEVKQRSRLETEVRIAREIQESLLPEPMLETPWCSIAGRALPATEVGGDFFDIIPLSEDRIAVAIADVTGHGVGAGILGAMTKSALRAQLIHGADPKDVLTTLNAALFQLSDQKTFVTFGYALIDRSARSVRYATAGHPPLLFRNARGSVEPLRTVNLALGLKQDAAFSTASLAFAAGDALILYTDGILEAANARGEEFGADRLNLYVAAGPNDPAELCNGAITALSGFVGTETFQDDVSIVAVRFLT